MACVASQWSSRRVATAAGQQSSCSCKICAASLCVLGSAIETETGCLPGVIMVIIIVRSAVGAFGRRDMRLPLGRQLDGSGTRCFDRRPFEERSACRVWSAFSWWYAAHFCLKTTYVMLFWAMLRMRRNVTNSTIHNY